MVEQSSPKLNKTRDFVVEAKATSIEKWRKQVVAGQPETGKAFAYISDEGTYIPGGEGTAPSPLTYFVSGVALCLISHITQIANKKKLIISNECAEVSAHFRETGSVLRGDAESFCDGLDVKITLDSEEDPKEIAELIRLAHQLCYAEKAILCATPIHVCQKLNGAELEV